MARSTTRVRSGLVGLLFVLACISLVLSTIAVWAHQTLLVTDRFVAVTSRVVDEPAVQAAAANRLASEIVIAADVQGRIAGVLPSGQAFLAVPLTSAVEGVLDKQLTTVFASERAQTAFENAIRFAHARIVTLLRNDSDFVSVNGTTATIDLLPIAVEGLRALQEQGILPASIVLPDVVDPADREAAIANLESRLGRDLPDDFALIPIANANRIATAQAAVHAFDVVTVALVIITFLLYLGTILLSGRRLRMVFLLAIGSVVALVITRLLVRAALQGAIASLAAGDVDTVQTMITDLVSDLASWSWILVILGLIIAVVAVLVGRPDWTRPGVSSPGVASEGRETLSAWVREHRDGLSWTVGILLTVLIVWVALSPDLAILVGIGLAVVALAVGRRGRSGDTPAGDVSAGGPPASGPAAGGPPAIDAPPPGVITPPAAS